MRRFAIVLALLVGCSKEGPKSQSNPTADPAAATPTAPSPGTAPTRSARLPDLSARKTVPAPKSNLPAEMNPPGVPPIQGKLEIDRGVQYVDEVIGTGAAPVKGKKVSVHYSGWLTDGKPFDSSHDRGEPIQINFDAGQVIKGWDIGLSSMKAGGKRRIVLPADLAYGDRAMGDAIPAGSMLVFDIELVSVEN